MRAGIIIAVALLSAGCLSNTVASRNPEAEEKEYVVHAPIGRVSALLQEFLASQGIAVIPKKMPHELRLVASPGSGQVFCLMLRQAKGEGSVKTVVSVLPKANVDSEIWETIVRALEVFPIPEAEESTGQEGPTPSKPG